MTQILVSGSEKIVTIEEFNVGAMRPFYLSEQDIREGVHPGCDTSAHSSASLSVEYSPKTLPSPPFVLPNDLANPLFLLFLAFLLLVAS